MSRSLQNLGVKLLLYGHLLDRHCPLTPQVNALDAFDVRLQSHRINSQAVARQVAQILQVSCDTMLFSVAPAITTDIASLTASFLLERMDGPHDAEGAAALSAMRTVFAALSKIYVPAAHISSVMDDAMQHHSPQAATARIAAGAAQGSQTYHTARSSVPEQQLSSKQAQDLDLQSESAALFSWQASRPSTLLSMHTPSRDHIWTQRRTGEQQRSEPDAIAEDESSWIKDPVFGSYLGEIKYITATNDSGPLGPMAQT